MYGPFGVDLCVSPAIKRGKNYYLKHFYPIRIKKADDIFIDQNPIKFEAGEDQVFFANSDHLIKDINKKQLLEADNFVFTRLLFCMPDKLMPPEFMDHQVEKILGQQVIKHNGKFELLICAICTDPIEYDQYIEFRGCESSHGCCVKCNEYRKGYYGNKCHICRGTVTGMHLNKFYNLVNFEITRPYINVCKFCKKTDPDGKCK